MSVEGVRSSVPCFKHHLLENHPAKAVSCSTACRNPGFGFACVEGIAGPLPADTRRSVTGMVQGTGAASGVTADGHVGQEETDKSATMLAIRAGGVGNIYHAGYATWAICPLWAMEFSWILGPATGPN